VKRKRGGHKRTDEPTGRRGVTADGQHIPVLLAETLAYLDPQPGDRIVDCTLGDGGHALAIAQRIGTDGLLIGLDADDVSLARARARLTGLPLATARSNFRFLERVLDDLGIAAVDGVIFDFGVVSRQLDDPARGHSFRAEAPLDMRYDPRSGPTGEEVLAGMDEMEQVRLYSQAGYGRWSRRIARAVLAAQAHAPLTTTAFADAVASALPKNGPPRIHPATRAFTLLRWVVNDEAAAIREALTAACRRCRPGARVVAISYHSLEDGEVKRVFNTFGGRPPAPSSPFDPPSVAPEFRINILTKRPLGVTPEEAQENPRARSAKLRAGERV
jgi:16S rRNA (cytosine1402-N4)-methyltransferase